MIAFCRTFARAVVLAAGVAVTTAPADAAETAGGFQPTADQQEILDRVESYMDGLRRVRARLVQYGPEGEVANGTLYLKRPKRMRLEYDAEKSPLLVADGYRIVYYDPMMEQVDSFGFDDTPAGILLKDDIDLDGAAINVTDMTMRPDRVTVSLVHARDPGAGTLSLRLSRDPLEIRGWRVLDAQGKETVVRLKDLETGVTFDAGRFDFTNPLMGGAG